MNKVKYYVIPIDGYNQFDAAQKLADLNHISVKDVVFLGPNDQSQVFRVPYMQGYEGKAVVACSNKICEMQIDVESIKTGAITYNSQKDIFVVDCSSVIFKQVFTAKAIASQSLTPYLKFNIGDGNAYWNLDDDLNVYFNDMKPSTSPIIDPQPIPVVLPTVVPSTPKFTPDNGWDIEIEIDEEDIIKDEE